MDSKAINISVVSRIGLLGEGDPNFNLYFFVGENDSSLKGSLSCGSPGVHHPFAEMTFTWQMVQIAWHAL